MQVTHPMRVQEMQPSHNVQCNACALVVPLERAIRVVGEGLTQVASLQGCHMLDILIASLYAVL